MKRIIAGILVLCMVASDMLFAADSLDSLTAEQERLYLENHLSVQTSQHTDISGIGYMNDWGLYTSFGEGNTSTEWTPYLGYNQISKADFFRLAGYEDLALQEQKIEETRKNMVIAKWSLFGIASALILASPFAAIMSNSDFWQIAGLAMLGIGGALYIPCLILEFTEPESDIAVSFAVGVANNYNKRLLEAIR